MIHTLGAFLVALACAWLGVRRAQALTARVRALEALGAALEQMERELTFRLTPLPQLMGELSKDTQSPARELFARCRQELEGQECRRFSDIWAQLVTELPALTRDDCQALLPLGQVLGRYDGAGQASAIAGVRRALEALGCAAREDSCRLGRVYRAVGAAGGGFLAILLL